MAAREICFRYNDCSQSMNEEEGRGRAQALWRIAASQFSTVYCRSIGFADWHLDAVHGAALARLQAHQFGGFAGSFWIRESDRDFVAGVGGRVYRRSLQPAPRCDLDSN